MTRGIGKRIMPSQETQEQVIAYFDELASRHGDTPQGVGWSAAAQLRRFELLCTVGPLHGASILDVGCGSGRFLDYLESTGRSCDYHGIDISPRQIALARARRPDARDRFQIADVLQGVGTQYDFVVANGPINTRRGNPVLVMRRFIEALFACCRVGVCFTMTSSYGDTRNDGVHYYDPAEALAQAMTVTRWTKLDHTYLPHDFGLFYYRQPIAHASTRSA